MAIHDQRVYDGWVSLEGGVDAGRSANLLDPNQCVSSENLTFRGGHPQVRPGFRKLTENFLNPDHCYNHDGTDAGDVIVPGQEASGAYKSGYFQCIVGFNGHHGDDSLMALLNGRLFKIVPKDATCDVTEIVLPYRNTFSRPIGYMIQADKWLIAQDGQSLPIIYDGNIARRADSNNPDPTKTEIPVGTIMAYGMGRIVVVVNERDVAFGDLYGSHIGADPGDSIILFTERNFLAGGFDAAIPFNLGVATGAAFFPQLDTSTGNGQLMVFAERGASSYFMSLDRSLWQTSAFQIFSLLTTGLRGHRTISVVNEDLWFRAEDGYRSYRQARSEAAGWAHIPLSTPVSQFLDIDQPELLKYGSSIYFDNRIIGTCSPYWFQGLPYHNGLVVVDFDILSSFGTRFKPAWDGHWNKYNIKTVPLTIQSGMKINQLVTGRFNGVTRAFAFARDENFLNQLYEISLDDKDDWDGSIDFELVSRQMDFSRMSQGGANPYTETELYDGDIWLREVIE